MKSKLLMLTELIYQLFNHIQVSFIILVLLLFQVLLFILIVLFLLVLLFMIIILILLLVKFLFFLFLLVMDCGEKIEGKLDLVLISYIIQSVPMLAVVGYG